MIFEDLYKVLDENQNVYIIDKRENRIIFFWIKNTPVPYMERKVDRIAVVDGILNITLSK